ncbi:RHS repeat-associated core domain-containing protein [Enterobacter mori]
MMPDFTASLHAGTPEVLINGSAGFSVLSLRMLRSAVDEPVRFIITRTESLPRLLTLRQFGARSLTDTDGGLIPDATTISGLTGQALRLHTVDADAAFSLSDTAGRPLWARNGQGTVTTFGYERPENGGRLLTVTETPSDGDPRVRELTLWRHNISDSDRRYNLAGTPLKQCDNAGISAVLAVSLTGQPQEILTQLLRHDAPLPDWPASEADLEVGENGLRELAAYNTCGEILEQTSAAGILTSTFYDVAGAVNRVSVTPGDGITQMALSTVTRAADGLVLAQTAGNGLSQMYEYDPRTRRRRRHLVRDPAGVPLSDLHYTYDPAGNMRTLCDAAVETTWHRNGESDGERVYSYDTLYRLVRVESRQKVFSSGRRGPFPARSADGSAGAVWVPYAETYTYDAGDNLIKTVREGNAGHDGWTRRTVISARSNRGVMNTADAPVGEPHDAFLDGGLLKELAGGRGLRWSPDGTLSGVARPGGSNDEETYSYRAQGVRVRKRSVQDGAEVRLTTYAGGCEWRQRAPSEGVLDAEGVIADAAGMRVIRIMDNGHMSWVVRWSWQDHLGSINGEMDEYGKVTSREEYTPYGESLGGDEAESGLSRRARRYVGKERDATGLYYYGWRYYQPESGRWLSADPGGLVDGINLFRFCRGAPTNIVDDNGFAGKHWQQLRENVMLKQHSVYPPRGASYRFEQFYDPASITDDSRNWRGVQYWDAEHRQYLRARGNDGLLTGVNKEGNTFVFSSYGDNEGNAILSHAANWQGNQFGYVLGRGTGGEKELILFRHIANQIHHSSAFAGRGVLDAGMMTIAHGQVVYLENKSGHYTPNIEQKMHTLNYLKEQGISLDDVFLSEMSPSPDDDDFSIFMERNLYRAHDFMNYYEDRSNKPPVRKVTRRALPPAVGIPSYKILTGNGNYEEIRAAIESTVAGDTVPLAAMTARLWHKDSKGGPDKITTSRNAYIPFAQRREPWLSRLFTSCLK